MPTKNETQNRKLIRTIAEIVIISIHRHDADTIDKGIMSLERIAIQFLQTRAEHPQKFQIVEGPAFDPYDEVQNQYILYVRDELLRIFKVSIDDRDEYASKQIIHSYYKILVTALNQPNNRVVLKLLFDFKEHYGSLHLQMMDFAIDKKAKFEKNRLLPTLKAVPELFLVGKGYGLEYVEEFISFHTFRIFKLIIDKNDFGSFVELLEYFSSTLFVRAYNIYDTLLLDLSPQSCDDETYVQIEKIRDILKYEFKKDYTLTNKNMRFGRLTNEFGTLEDLLAGKGMEKNEIETKKNNLFKKINKIYIQTLLSSLFFVVGAYLLHKGEQYSHWLSKMWYYTKPEHSRITYVNELPIMKEPLSEVCFAMYEGIGSRLGLHIEFEEYSDPIPYLYQYAVLSMLRDDNCVLFPTNDKIAEWKRNRRTVAIMFWYEILTLFPINDLTNALKALKPGFMDAIRPEDLEISKRIDKLNKNLQELENTQKSQIAQLELAIDVSQVLVDNQIQRIKNYYKEKSQISLLAHTNKSSAGEFTKIEASIPPIPRVHFIDQKFMGCGGDMGEAAVTIREERHLHDVLSEQLPKQKLEFNLQAFTSVVQNMKNMGYHPNVIFVPKNIINQVGQEQNQLYSFSSQNIEIAGETLKIIRSWWGLQFSNIIIYDKNYLKVTYKDEIDITVGDTDKQAIVFNSSIDMRIEILDPTAFVHISTL